MLRLLQMHLCGVRVHGRQLVHRKRHLCCYLLHGHAHSRLSNDCWLLLRRRWCLRRRRHMQSSSCLNFEMLVLLLLWLLLLLRLLLLPPLVACPST